MKNYLTILIAIAISLISCNSDKSHKQNAVIYIDSVFITKMNTNGLKESNLIKDFEINDNGDSVFSFIKPKMKFWIHNEKDFNEKVKLKILLTNEPKDMALDGSLNLAYLGTFNNKNQLLDLLRIGKHAVFSDTDDLETCTIKENLIQKKVRTYEASENGFDRVETKQTYLILESGKFKKL